MAASGICRGCVHRPARRGSAFRSGWMIAKGGARGLRRGAGHGALRQRRQPASRSPWWGEAGWLWTGGRRSFTSPPEARERNPGRRSLGGLGEGEPLAFRGLCHDRADGPSWPCGTSTASSDAAVDRGRLSAGGVVALSENRRWRGPKLVPGCTGAPFPGARDYWAGSSARPCWRSLYSSIARAWLLSLNSGPAGKYWRSSRR